MTDHGPALPRAKSTLYDAGTGIAMIVRPPRGTGDRGRVYDDLFSGVDLVPTLLELLGVPMPADVDGLSHAANLLRIRPPSPARARRGVHDEDLPRFFRSHPGDPDQGIQLHRELRSAAAARPALGHRGERARAGGGAADARAPRPERELYDLRRRPHRDGTTCSIRADDRQGRGHRRTTWRCCSTTGGRRPTTSFRPSSPAPASPSATPKPICTSTESRYQPVGDGGRSRHRRRVSTAIVVFVTSESIIPAKCKPFDCG